MSLIRLKHRKIIFFSGLLLGLIFTSCNDSSSKENNSQAFIGGQIMNPLSEYFILYKDNKPLDTVYLDTKNKFKYHFKDVKTGVYVFRHGAEQQNVYLNPGDSILLNLNTFEFNESLYFSGQGAEKNNFLLDMFLRDEKNADLIFNYYEYGPEDFIHLTDSITTHRLNSLDKLQEKTKITEEFREFSQKLIAYENYDLKERYTYMVKKYYPEFIDKFPGDFHEYRKNANFNEESLQTNSIYVRFIENYMINKTITECLESNAKNDCFKLYDHENIIKRINFIDSLTDLKLIQDHFYTKLGAVGMVMGKNKEDMVEILILLLKKGLEKEKREKIRQIGQIQLAFLPGVNVGSINLLYSSGDKIRFDKIITKPTIVYIWSIHSSEHHKALHKQITDYREKYPEIDFIGMNIDLGESSNWRNALMKYDYDPEKEFQLETEFVGKESLQYYLNKLLFVNAKGEVIIGDVYINSPEFESTILEFLNQ